MKRADSNQKTLLALFFVLAGLLVLRYCAYGLSYYPQLDDYIQYHNYRHSPTSVSYTHLTLPTNREV